MSKNTRLTKDKYLDEAEYTALTKKLELLFPVEPRNCAYIALLLHTGARAREALALTYADIDTAESTVKITGSKNSYSRELPIPRWLLVELLKLNPGASPSARVFNVGYHAMRDAWHSISKLKKGLHCLRHTKAMRLYFRTKDFGVVKSWLGHKSINSTNVYISHALEKDHMRQGLEE